MFCEQAGKVGIIEDIPGYRIAPEGWTTTDNIRFNDGYAEKSLGYSSFVTPSVAPYYLLPLQETTIFYWIYFGAAAIYLTDGTNNILASSTSYNGDADNNWIGDIFGGVPVATNGIDAPQMLYPVSPNNTFADLTNWPTGYTCKSIKGFNNYLIALNVVKNGVQNPYMVKWSHQTDAGSIPSSWDETDTTVDAGEKTFGEKGGYIVDGGILGDSFIIYRENAAHSMRYIGGQYIFGFEKILNKGIFGPRCFVEFKSGHCVLTDDDLIVHSGTRNSDQSIADNRVRTTLFTALNGATNATRTFLSHNKKKNEIWVCYPTGSDAYPTKALIWNYKHNTFSYHDLPGTLDIKFNVVSSTSGSTWATDSTTWAAGTDRWGSRSYNPSKRDMLMADTANTKLYKIDDTNQFNAVSFTATLQRTDILFDNDPSKQFREIEIYPLMTGTGPVNVRIGYQDVPGGSVTWEAAQSFTPGTDYKLDFRSTGRLGAIEFASTGDVDWRLHAYDIKTRVASNR